MYMANESNLQVCEYLADGANFKPVLVMLAQKMPRKMSGGTHENPQFLN